MYNLYSILNNIEDLPNGETKRLDCPECGGYKTFTATNNMGRLLWNCYKASCSVRGSTRVHLSVDEIRDIQNKQKSQVVTNFELPEYVVSHNGRSEIDDWCNKWGLDPQTLDLFYGPTESLLNSANLSSIEKKDDKIGRFFL